MPAVCRVGDSFSGVCTAHQYPTSFTGTWISGTAGMGVMKADGLGVVRVDDTSPTSCGHTAKASIGSQIVKDSNKSIHRVGDAITVVEGGSGTSTTGSNTVTAS